MREKINLQTLLSQEPSRHLQLASFALLCLGITESLSKGLISATASFRLFFYAENCLFIRKHLKDKIADQIMSHGVKLSDLFDILPVEEAQREFQREVAMINSLCLQLLDDKKMVA